MFGENREILLVWVRGEKGGLASIWNDNGAYVSLWRSVFVRLAWDHIGAVEQIAGKSIGQGNTLRQLKPGHRLFVYIPKGNGVGGYVGAGNVVGEARLAKDLHRSL